MKPQPRGRSPKSSGVMARSAAPRRAGRKAFVCSVPRGRKRVCFDLCGSGPCADGEKGLRTELTAFGQCVLDSV